MDRIVVASGVTADITLRDLTIDASARNDIPAFDMTGATVNLTLSGTNILKSGGNRAGLLAPQGSTLTISAADTTHTLTSTGGNNGAGIGGGRDGAGGTVTISGGTVTATGGSSGAGIGGAGGAGGTITINGGTVTATGGSDGAGIGGAGGTVTISGGTVTATGGSAGAGIGGGYWGDGGTVTISGGTVTATGGFRGAGIGGGYLGAAGTIEALSGNAVVFASSIAPTLTAGDNAIQAIVFIGNTGTIYGSVTLEQDVTIPSVHTLDLSSGNTLIIPGNVTLTNNGTIVVYPGGVINGTVTGNQPVDSDLIISGGSSYTYSGGLLTVTGNGTYTVGMNGLSATTTDHITVASGVNAAITLSAVNIDMSGTNNTAAFDMTSAMVNLTLVGTNILKSGGNRAGLHAPEGSTLTINAADGTHTLTAAGGSSAAGIGGGGTITISGGTVTATGGNYGAGIGGAGGTVTISGGTVTATGGYGGAGIGGDYRGAGGTVTISGGTVTATGSYGGAAIGGGDRGAGGTVTISGGTVTATGSYSGAGIGGGYLGDAGSIAGLSGNAVIFASSIQPTITAGENATQAIAFNGNTGTMYGSVTLQQDVTIPSTHTLDLASGQTLTIPGTVTLTNEGTINKNGGTIAGSVAGGGTVY
jgi:hypothetical protein